MREKMNKFIRAVKSFTSSERAVRMSKKEGERIERVVALYLRVVGKRKDAKVHVTSVICDVGEFPVIEIHCEDFCAELNYGSKYMLSNIDAVDKEANNVLEMLYGICKDVLDNKTNPSLLSKDCSLNLYRMAHHNSNFPNSWVIMNAYK